MLNWLERESGTDLLQKALASGCTPIRCCYLGTYTLSQLSRAHDARRRPRSVQKAFASGCTPIRRCYLGSFPECMTRVGAQIRCLAWHKC
eukprot:3936666-Rhodomonas_salina.1